MAEDNLKGRRLSSWKEIAEYLGWDERTCLRWEKNLGLPVQRIDPESKRSRVFAYADDLDKWLQGRGHHKPQLLETSDPVEHADGARESMRKPRGIFPWARPAFFALAGAALLGLGYLAFFNAPGEPADFEVRGSVLAVKDASGRNLWTYDTGADNLRGTDFYRQHFQDIKIDANNFGQSFPFLIMKDIDADGKREVLFAAQSQDPVDMGPLICFDHSGNELWRFEPGGERVYGQRNFSDDYYLEILDVQDLDGDGRLEVIAVANQIPFFPTQVAILNCRGELIGEYWNAGRLSRYAAADLNADGRKELFFAGKNNEYHKPCLVVFDSARVEGGSPQSLDCYRSPQVGQGTEMIYALFPKTDIDRVEDPGGDSFVGIQRLRNNRWGLWTTSSFVCYEFDGRDRISSVHLSDTFRRKYERYRDEGRIEAGELDETAFTDALAAGILYHNGREWTSEPFSKSIELVRKQKRNFIPR